ncbi:hypothetical protein D3C86_1957930 [compost metagenome]
MTEHYRHLPALVLQEQIKRIAYAEHLVCHGAPESPVLHSLVSQVDRIQLPGFGK